jgi:cardiolipin synthase A/B
MVADMRGCLERAVRCCSASCWEFRRVEIYEYQVALLQSETMVIDGVWATVGSTNFDNRSFALNEELNVVLNDRSIAARLTQAFESDLARSRRVTYEAWKRRGVATQIFEIFVAPIASQL